MATDETQAERRLAEAIRLLRQLRARRGGACVACGVIASSRSGPCCEWAGAYRALLTRAQGGA